MTAPAYATETQFRAFIRDPSVNDPDVIDHALLSASRYVDKLCGRRFYKDAAANDQFFSPNSNNLYWLNFDDMDLSSTTDLAVHVQFANSGSYSEVRTLNTDFVPQPVNRSVNGIEGWPYTSLQSLAKIWPQRYGDFYLDTVKVTGIWGWPAFPDPVVDATLIRAAEMFKSGEAPFGVLGFDAFGAVRVRENPLIASMLQPYKKQSTAFLIA